MKFQGTMLGLVFKVLSLLSAAGGLVTMVMGLAAEGDLGSKVGGYLVYWQGAGALGFAITLWWMAAVVDYLAQIAENTAARSSSGIAPRSNSTPERKQSSASAKKDGAATYVLD